MRKPTYKMLLFACCFVSLLSCAQPQSHQPQKQIAMNQIPAENLDTATLGGGCYWCTEAQYQLLDGVVSVTSGFSGGHVKNPAYREVCNGNTGHAEVVQVIYDNRKLSFQDILEAFFAGHDPTQLNRQGNDIGTQYRSVIFYHNEQQHQTASDIKEKLNNSGAYQSPVVTEISPFTAFYKAEEYHQNYFNQNGDEPYCQFVVAPKVEKFKKVFKDKLKH